MDHVDFYRICCVLDFEDQFLNCLNYLYQSNCNDKIEKKMKFKIVMSGFIFVFPMVRNVSRESKMIILFVSDRKS